MRKFPKIVFKIDYKIDVQTLGALLKESNSKLGKQSLKWALEPHPVLKIAFQDRRILLPCQQELGLQ